MRLFFFFCRCSPEGLFLELALTDTNTNPADNLGITLGLDVNYLYEIVAVQKLKDGQSQQAVKLFNRSEVWTSRFLLFL